LKDLDTQELKAKVHEIEEQMFRLRFQMSMGQTDGPEEGPPYEEGPGAGSTPSCAPANWPRAKGLNMAEERKQHKNEKLGEVVSTKMAKTIVVTVTRRVPHPLYKRIVTKRKKFYATTKTVWRNGRYRADYRMPSAEQAEAVAPG
jgi:hypothetical protein